MEVRPAEAASQHDMIARSNPTEEEPSRVDRDPRAHTPVLVPEVLAALDSETDGRSLEGWILDGTLGAGGHSRAILEAYPGVRILGVDQDPSAIAEAEHTLEEHRDRVVIHRGRMSEILQHCSEEGITELAGVLFDLGANSLHFDRPERGFSMQADGPLDMRMDPTRQRTAADIINRWDESDLADLFYYEGGERKSRRIAKAIVTERRRAPFLRTIALADLIARTVGGAKGRIHPATKVFQALRRAVNEEGEELVAGLSAAEELLREGGRLCVLTFHSGEDGMVKRFFAEGVREGRWNQGSKKPLAPTHAEVRSNPRARSARLRFAERKLHGSRFSEQAPGPNEWGDEQ